MKTLCDLWLDGDGECDTTLHWHDDGGFELQAGETQITLSDTKKVQAFFDDLRGGWSDSSFVTLLVLDQGQMKHRLRVRTERGEATFYLNNQPIGTLSEDVLKAFAARPFDQVFTDETYEVRAGRRIYAFKSDRYAPQKVVELQLGIDKSSLSILGEVHKGFDAPVRFVDFTNRLTHTNSEFTQELSQTLGAKGIETLKDWTGSMISTCKKAIRENKAYSNVLQDNQGRPILFTNCAGTLWCQSTFPRPMLHLADTPDPTIKEEGYTQCDTDILMRSGEAQTAVIMNTGRTIHLDTWALRHFIKAPLPTRHSWTEVSDDCVRRYWRSHGQGIEIEYTRMRNEHIGETRLFRRGQTRTTLDARDVALLTERLANGGNSMFDGCEYTLTNEEKTSLGDWLSDCVSQSPPRHEAGLSR